MIHQSFYRAYRPQTFRDMSGQLMVKQTLQNALTHNRTTHAYLFSGPRGTGKTTTAKVFAKALNCERGPAAEPCNECATCVSITEGSNTDVIEFDAASNSRVEEMREIIGKVHVAPARSRRKVYIIDEVHMLSNSAFNALLKTLEEPPSHVVFILATTESYKLPLTIISRCQRFDFKPLTTEEIIDRLRVVLKDVNVEAEEGALDVIAHAANGGMRDALSMLDQVVAFSDTQVTTESALLITGSISEQHFLQLAEAITTKDAKTALILIDQLIREGKDELRLVEDSITFFRDLLLLRTSESADHLFQAIRSRHPFEEVASRFSVEQLYECIDIFAKAQQEMRFSNYARVYIESALLKLIHMMASPTSPSTTAVDHQPGTAQVEQQLDSLRQTVSQLQRHISEQPNRPSSTQMAKPSRKNPNQSTFRVPKAKIEAVLTEATRDDLNAIRSNWAMVMQSLLKSHAALLEETEPVAASATAFVLKFKYEIHCTMALEKDDLQRQLSEAVQRVIQRPGDVVFVPEEHWQAVRSNFLQTRQLLPNASEREQHREEGTDVVKNEQEEQPFDTQGEASMEEHVVRAEQLFGDIVTVIDE